MKAKNYYFESYFNPYNEKIVGLVILSQLERVNNGMVASTEGRNYGIYADLIHNNDTFRVYNIHLESIYLKNQDYSVLFNKQDKQTNNESLKTTSVRIIKKLKRAFIKRSQQVNHLISHIELCSYPVIICGDFNDLPTSYTYKTLSENLMDAFTESGYGNGSTFKSKLPFFRIDYILYDPCFQSFNYQSDKLQLSDHQPVSVSLSIQ
jgi:endonuclease/exonuclease/phosphatase family metal-dependent hydrolase